MKTTEDIFIDKDENLIFLLKQMYGFYRCATIELNLPLNGAIDESIVVSLHNSIKVLKL